MILIYILLTYLTNQINGQIQRTHFPKPLTQTKVIQCPLNSECRPIVQCDNQQELKLNPNKLIICGYRHSLPMVCCNPSRNTRFQNRLFQNDHNLPDFNRLKNKRIKRNYEICGTRIKQISLYIVGGNRVVSKTKYPWFASLALVKDNSYFTDDADNSTKFPYHHYCGTSLISDQFVITSAHCFPLSSVDESDLTNYRIGVGNIELPKMQFYEIEQVFIHPKASTENHYNDIALIKLKRKLRFSSNVRPICLPFLDFSDSEESNNFDNKEIDNSNRFTLPDYDQSNLEMYGFRNQNFNQNYRSLNNREPFYGFTNPNYQPNSNLRNKQFPFRTANRFMSNYYQFRKKRSSEIKFKKENLYNELFNKPSIKVVVAGLGDTSFGGVSSPILKEADLMIVNKNRCNEMYSKLNSTSLKEGLTDEFLCAADRRLATKLNENESSLIDPRSPKRSKRSINFWINYFSDRLKENKEKKMNKSSRSNDKLKVEKKEHLSTTRIEKVEKNSSNDEYDKEDLVNILTEEELHEKLASSYYSDSCQGDSGGGMYLNLDTNLFNKTIQQYKSNHLVKEKLIKELDMINMYKKLDQKGLEGKFYLSGLISLGRECGNKEWPGVYINVNYHRDWILEIVDFDNTKYRL